MSWFRTEISINLNADKEPFVFTLGQAFLLILLSVSLGVSYFFYERYNSAIDKESEARKLSKSVEQIAVVPPESTPTIATVTDPKALEDQTFFVNAQTGDKVLIYIEAKRAVLYRPSTNKIVEIGPFALPENLGASQ